MTNSKSEGRDVVYVGADDIYLCPPVSGYINEDDGKALRRYCYEAD